MKCQHADEASLVKNFINIHITAYFMLTEYAKKSSENRKFVQQFMITGRLKCGYGKNRCSKKKCPYRWGTFSFSFI